MNSYQLVILSIVMGSILFIFTSCSLIPQIYSFRKTRNSSGISLISYSISVIDNIFWLIWAFGFYFNSMLMYQEEMNRVYQISLLILCFAYIFGSALVCYLLIVKIKHVLLAKANKMSELELANVLLKKDKAKFFINKKWNNIARYFVPTLAVIIVLLISFTSCAIVYVFGYVKPIHGSKEWMWVIVIGFVASFIFEITTWPQLIKSFKQKDTTGLSLFWCVFGAINTVVNFGYDFILGFISGGFSKDILFVLIFSGIIPSLGVMILKVRNVIKAKKAGMTEVQYTKKILIPSLKKKSLKTK